MGVLFSHDIWAFIVFSPNPGEDSAVKKDSVFKAPKDKNLPVKKYFMNRWPMNKSPAMNILNDPTLQLDRKRKLSGNSTDTEITVEETPEEPLQKAKQGWTSKGKLWLLLCVQWPVGVAEVDHHESCCCPFIWAGHPEEVLLQSSGHPHFHPGEPLIPLPKPDVGGQGRT